MEHEDNCECYTCKYGIEAMKQHQQDCIEKDGWYAHLLTDDPNSPTGFNAHTHHVYESYRHPDIQIVFPLPQKTLMRILHTVVNHIKAGKNFGTDKEYDKILNGYNVRFILTTETGKSPEWKNEQTSDHIVLRMILPSPNGSLYAETMGGCDDRLSNDFYRLQEQMIETFEFPE